MSASFNCNFFVSVWSQFWFDLDVFTKLEQESQVQTNCCCLTYLKVIRYYSSINCST